MKIVKAHEVKRDIMRYAFFERSHIAVVTEGLNQADVLSITGAKLAVEFEVKVSKSDLDKELAAIRYATMVMKENKQLAPVDSGPEQAALNLEFAGLKTKAGGWSKISKHEEYLDPKKYSEEHRISTYWNYRYVPNYFYMVVPNRLVAYTAEKLTGTGYGVIAYDGCRQEGQHYGRFHEGKWYDNYGEYPEGAVWQRGLPCDRATCYQEIAVKQKPKRIHSEPVSDTILMQILNRAVTENIRMFDELTNRGVNPEDSNE